MYQIVADNQLIDTVDLLNVIQSFASGMVPALIGVIRQTFQLWSWSPSCKNGFAFITVGPICKGLEQVILFHGYFTILLLNQQFL